MHSAMLMGVLALSYYDFRVALLLTLTIEALQHLMTKLTATWNAATPKHRAEYLYLCVFFYRFWFRTNLKVSRAYLPLFRCFFKKPLGLSFMIVQIIVHERDTNEVCYAKRAKCEKPSDHMFDLGASGYVPSHNTAPHPKYYREMPFVECLAVIAAFAELNEELALDSTHLLQYHGMTMPCDGYDLICYQFTTSVSNRKEIVLARTDGTFTDVYWCAPEKLLEQATQKMKPLQHKVFSDGVMHYITSRGPGLFQ